MAAPPGTMMITVPPNTAPGATLQVTAPNGQPIMVQVPPGHGPGSTFAVRVPGPPAPPAQPVLVQPTVVSAPGMPVPPQPTPAQNYAALAAANAPPPQTAPLPTPKGPCLLVDHLDRPGDAFIPLGSMSLGADRGGQAFAGYIADDMDGAGAKPAFAAVISGGAGQLMVWAGVEIKVSHRSTAPAPSIDFHTGRPGRAAGPRGAHLPIGRRSKGSDRMDGRRRGRAPPGQLADSLL